MGHAAPMPREAMRRHAADVKTRDAPRIGAANARSVHAPPSRQTPYGRGFGRGCGCGCGFGCGKPRRSSPPRFASLLASRAPPGYSPRGACGAHAVRRVRAGPADFRHQPARAARRAALHPIRSNADRWLR
ncbi:NADPH oxidase activator 1 [Burkholderia pseudomallei MSHR346]|nr:NADPH oxidase activator 1 [Burkholderia pseudomallei MSHR346]